MGSPLFTVITANFNSGDKLVLSAASVRAQAVDAELLIVDGASTDGSLQLAQRLGAESASVRVISEPDRGVYDAMNKGIRVAKGRYIYFLGAGDVLRPGAMRAIGTALPAHDRGLIYGDAWLLGTVYAGPFDWRKLAYQNICHQAAFYGREVFRLLGDYDLTYKYWADHEFNLRCFGSRRVEKRYVPVIVADFEAGGISRNGDARFDADRLMLLRKHYGLIRYGRMRLRQRLSLVKQSFRSHAAPPSQT